VKVRLKMIRAKSFHKLHEALCKPPRKP